MTEVVVSRILPVKNISDFFVARRDSDQYRNLKLSDERHPLLTWPLRPQSSAKAFPAAIIPQVLINDYEEACSIKNLSPKASATLSRRCIQGIIRDFWKITKSRLLDEINELEGKIDAQTWQAIDAVRSVGNIGAHMEKDIIGCDVNRKKRSY